MTDFLQRDIPIRFPVAGDDWWESLEDKTNGEPAVESPIDLSGDGPHTLTYGATGVVYTFDGSVDTWTGAVSGGGGGGGAIGEVETPSIVSPADGSSDLGPGDVTLTGSYYNNMNGAGAHDSTVWEVFEADIDGIMKSDVIISAATVTDTTTVTVAGNLNFGRFQMGSPVEASEEKSPITDFINGSSLGPDAPVQTHIWLIRKLENHINFTNKQLVV